MDDTAFHYAGDNSPDKGDGEGVIDMEFEWCIGIIVAVMGEDVEESANEVEALTGDIRNLENGADAAANKLRLRKVSGCRD